MTALQSRISELKRERNAFILAHYYQTLDVQRIADFIGDSFEMARIAAQSDKPVLVVCGVRFMAESAKLLSPHKTVLLPAPDAGCPMADMVIPEDVMRLRKEHPHAAVMCYVNSSADVKALSDICCTSSSAVRVAKSLPNDEIIFIPDQNLGAYTASQVPEKRFILFEGYCPIHHAIRTMDVERARAAHPGARLLVHPECRPEVTALADFVGSTAQILREVEHSDAESYLIGTECGIVERLRESGKAAYALSTRMNCPNMKKTTVEDVENALMTLSPAVEISRETSEAASRSLRRMVDVG